jgi:hypothetical protein
MPPGRGWIVDDNSHVLANADFRRRQVAASGPLPRNNVLLDKPPKARTKYKHPLNLPSKFYRPIGEIAYRWNLAEALMLSLCWHFMRLNDPKKARLLTMGMNADRKVQLFEFVIRQWVADPTRKSELGALHKRIDRLRKSRNKIVHGIWGHPPGSPEILKLFSFKDNDERFLPRAEPFSNAQLKAVADDLHKLNRDLRTYSSRIGAPAF